MSLQQDVLDYSNDAQMRVASDTRVLRKKTTLHIVAGQGSYVLPADVITVMALIDGQTQLPYMTPDEALIDLTAPPIVQTRSYYTIGNAVGILPVPTEADTLTMFYVARPAPLQSDDPFELQGDYELLIDRLVQAYKLSDDGQPELAAAEMSYYDYQTQVLRRRSARQGRERVRFVVTDG